MSGTPRKDEASAPQPLKEGARAFRSCLCVLLAAMLGGGTCAGLVIWGGSVGRCVASAVGFGVAGVILPLYSGIQPRGRKQERFLIWLCLATGVGGAAMGAWLGAYRAELPLWVFTAAGLAACVGAGAVAVWVQRRAGRH